MPRPKRTDRPVEKHLPIPTSLVAEVELRLYSELEGKVPHGAWARLVERLLQEWVARNPVEPAENPLLNEIQATVAEIRKCMHRDAEQAHTLEDRMYVKTLQFIAANPSHPDIGEMAREALKAHDLPFPRWCA